MTIHGRSNAWDRQRRLPINVHRAHYVIEYFPPVWSISIFRGGHPTNIIPVSTKAEAVRTARALSDAGLIGVVDQRP